MQRACCAVIASGTATLEAAYYGLPYCLVYRVAPLTYLMAKMLVKIKFIGLVNILGGRGSREGIDSGGGANPEAVALACCKASSIPLKSAKHCRLSLRKRPPNSVARVRMPARGHGGCRMALNQA